MAERHGPVTVVTGGGQGLGRTFSEYLAGTGHRVAVIDINADSAETVARAIGEFGGTACAYGVDVSDLGAMKEVAAKVATDLGQVSGLVNNAALFSTLAMGGFEEIDVATWERVMRVNVTGTFVASRAFVPAMRAAGYGKIVNISSATFFTGRAGYLHYVTSKGAIIALTRALASELGPVGIRVNALAPGSTETEIERTTITRADREALASTTAIGRVQVPQDLTGSIEYFLSHASDFVTGQTMVVDGGLAFN